MCVWLLECVQVGLDWVFTHDAIYILHVTCSCILLVVIFSPLSFSLSWIDYAWHPRCVNILQARILFKVLVLFLLLILFPLFMFGSMTRRPVGTSWRTFRNMAFIRSVILFCWTFSTLLYLVSFGLGARILLWRNPWGVQLYLQEFYSNIHGIDTSVPCFVMTFQGTRIVVTPDLISEALHVPRVSHPNYHGCEHL